MIAEIVIIAENVQSLKLPTTVKSISLEINGSPDRSAASFFATLFGCKCQGGKWKWQTAFDRNRFQTPAPIRFNQRLNYAPLDQ